MNNPPEPVDESYSYSATVKSPVSDELINTYLLRPIAGIIVRILYPTPVTPNQVTLASTAAGLLAAALYLPGSYTTTALAGLCVTLKDLLDSADGQLARAKTMYSRTGRFLDSIGDFAVNLALFGAIAWTLWTATGNASVLWLAPLGFLGISLRVSYHVFYQTSFLHLQDSYALNRTTEEIRQEDLAGDRRALRLQKIFLILYGWQDALIEKLDRHSGRSRLASEHAVHRWYTDPTAVRLSGLTGIGTELFLLMLCSLANALEFYLYLNVIGMNIVWGCCVAYRRIVLLRRIKGGEETSGGR
jgi:phosphatidylglycerophosphate synthase